MEKDILRNIIMITNYYLKVIIKMEKEMEKEKNIIMRVK